MLQFLKNAAQRLWERFVDIPMVEGRRDIPAGAAGIVATATGTTVGTENDWELPVIRVLMTDELGRFQNGEYGICPEHSVETLFDFTIPKDAHGESAHRIDVRQQNLVDIKEQMSQLFDSLVFLKRLHNVTPEGREVSLDDLVWSTGQYPDAVYHEVFKQVFGEGEVAVFSRSSIEAEMNDIEERMQHAFDVFGKVGINMAPLQEAWKEGKRKIGTVPEEALSQEASSYRFMESIEKGEAGEAIERVRELGEMRRRAYRVERCRDFGNFEEALERDREALSTLAGMAKQAGIEKPVGSKAWVKEVRQDLVEKARLREEERGRFRMLESPQSEASGRGAKRAEGKQAVASRWDVECTLDMKPFRAVFGREFDTHISYLDAAVCIDFSQYKGAVSGEVVASAVSDAINSMGPGRLSKVVQPKDSEQRTVIVIAEGHIPQVNEKLSIALLRVAENQVGKSPQSFLR